MEHSEFKLCFVGILDKGPWAEMKDAIPADIPVVTFPLCPEDVPNNTVTWDSILKDKKPFVEPVTRISKKWRLSFR